MTRPPAVKVCGLMRPQDAEAAARAGASYLGVILAPGHRRSVTAADANVILGGLPTPRAGVFVDAPVDVLLRDAEAARLSVVQLHGDEDPALGSDLHLMGYQVWKAVRVRSADDVRVALDRWTGVADAILLDGFSERGHGGTGTSFDWEAVAALRDSFGGTRFVAAGGLRPENVARAARILRPDVVDVSSGVESAPGVKDPQAVRAFLQAVGSLSLQTSG